LCVAFSYWLRRWFVELWVFFQSLWPIISISSKIGIWLTYIGTFEKTRPSNSGGAVEKAIILSLLLEIVVGSILVELANIVGRLGWRYLKLYLIDEI
jgi:hypothetical protein